MNARATNNMLVCFALEPEAAPFRKLAAGRQGVSILVTGIGRKNAEKSVRAFLESATPARVLTCGFAGALISELRVGDVVFETDDEPMRKELVSAGATPAKFYCADRVATTAMEKQDLRRRTNADVVEMESGGISAVCQEHGLACATVRVISDEAGEDLPLDFNQLSKPDQSLDYGKLAWAIAKSPGKIGALRRLQRQTNLAAEQLAGVLAKITFP